MNYEQARQIGPNGPAPGKWNWSNANDSVQPEPWTAWPCAYPDSPIPKDWQFGQSLVRTGRERCDHDTQEEAERHYYEATIDALDWRPVDAEKASSLHRCDFPECGKWADGATAHAHGWPVGSYCKDHANAASHRIANPFSSGARLVHS